MKEISAKEVTDTVERLFIEANVHLGQDVVDALESALRTEESPEGREVLSQLLENASIAKREGIPICQDTGMAVVFVEMGQDVHLVGGSLEEAINEGVRRGYKKGNLRKSVCHPLKRTNTGDNTPAFVHLEVVPGEHIRIVAMPKGGGGENMSQVAMLTPAVGREGIIDFVLNVVREAGPNPCPPVILGIGIGGTFDKAALLSKKALLRPVGSLHRDEEVAALEREILSRVNDLGIGPQGYGGRTTALAAHVEIMPCHIASIPVAVNVQCHASRHREAVLS
jgi:fumarate hydratase subunit alpha